MLQKIRDSLASNPRLFSFLRKVIELGFIKEKTIITQSLKTGKDQKILDIGCGTGEFSGLFNKENYTGIDINKEYINFAKTKNKKNFLVMDATDLKFADNTFDAILIMAVLHHLELTGMERVLSEAKRVLKPNGKILILEDAKLEGQDGMLTKLVQKFDKGAFIREPGEYQRIALRYFQFLRDWSFRSGACTYYGMLLEKNNTTESKNIPEISIVVLCYQAGEPIRKFVDDLVKMMSENFGHDYELVLVGNYFENKDDVTPTIVKEIAAQSENIIAVTQIKEGMMGWDMRTGLEKTTGKNIAVIDGDGQMPINDLIRIYDVLKKDKADLAKTYRTSRGDSAWRIIISLVYNIFFKALFPGLNSKDINSKPKIFTRESYEKMNLESDDWFIDAEIMIQARRYHFKVLEISTFFRGLGGRRRSFVKFPAIMEFIKNLLAYRIKEFNYRKK